MSTEHVDVLIVGRPDQTELASELRKAEKALRREINYTVLSPGDLARRLKKGDAFVSDIWNGKRVELIAPDHDKTVQDQSDQDKAAKRRSKAGEAVSR